MNGVMAKALSLVLLLLIGAPALASEAVRIQLKWYHQFQFAGYYAALERGFFAEEGLDVELLERDPARNNILQVYDGEAEVYANTSVRWRRRWRAGCRSSAARPDEAAS